MFIVWSATFDRYNTRVTRFRFVDLFYSLESAKNSIKSWGDKEIEFINEIESYDYDRDRWRFDPDEQYKCDDDDDDDDDDSVKPLVFIGKTRDCPEYEFIGYCIEEVTPVDENESPVFK